MKTLNIEKMQKKILSMINEREWNQFHTPKNQCISLLLEASELLEIFQWLTAKESFELKNNSKKMDAVKEELADVLFWLLRISHHFEIDLEEAFWKKMEKNEKKYPIHLSKGKATKYTELASL